MLLRKANKKFDEKKVIICIKKGQNKLKREPTELIFSSPEQVWRNLMSGSLHPRCFLSSDYLLITRIGSRLSTTVVLLKQLVVLESMCRKPRAASMFRPGLTRHVVLNLCVCVCEWERESERASAFHGISQEKFWRPHLCTNLIWLTRFCV